jgi:hypothetical protein
VLITYSIILSSHCQKNSYQEESINTKFIAEKWKNWDRESLSDKLMIWITTFSLFLMLNAVTRVSQHHFGATLLTLNFAQTCTDNYFIWYVHDSTRIWDNSVCRLVLSCISVFSCSCQGSGRKWLQDKCI